MIFLNFQFFLLSIPLTTNIWKTSSNWRCVILLLPSSQWPSSIIKTHNRGDEETRRRGHHLIQLKSTSKSLNSSKSVDSSKSVSLVPGGRGEGGRVKHGEYIDVKTNIECKKNRPFFSHLNLLLLLLLLFFACFETFLFYFILSFWYIFFLIIILSFFFFFFFFFCFFFFFLFFCCCFWRICLLVFFISVFGFFKSVPLGDGTTRWGQHVGPVT